jgi:thiamine biosynthesis lipoprotein
MRRTAALFVAAAVALGALALQPRDRAFVRSYDQVLGTTLDLKILAASGRAADAAADAVLAEITRQAGILSGYDPASEFSRWMETRNVAVGVSSELFEVLQRFDQWRARTGGALDAAAETVSRVWKASAGAGRLPTGRELSDAVTRVRQAHWRLDPEHRTATRLSDAPLVLNTFTKSYIVDRAAGVALRTPDVRGVVVNIGGDLVVRGQMAERVAIADPAAAYDNARPLTHVAIRDLAVATSGGYRRGFDINGAHYSHIVDPRTGRPTGHVLSATVVAKDAADAGALATAFCVLTPAEIAELARGVAGVQYLLVLADGRRIESDGWRQLVSALPPMPVRSPVASLSAAEQDTWNPEFVLTITIQLAPPQGKGLRPYVAVWIENATRFPLRTLAVWHLLKDPTWDYKLREWLRGDKQRMEVVGTELLASVSSATRGPGVHKLVWDGKNNSGQLVRAGTYTVFIEAVREGGTYQIMRQAMDFTGVPKKIDLGSNVEISSATLDYHRVPPK